MGIQTIEGLGTDWASGAMERAAKSGIQVSALHSWEVGCPFAKKDTKGSGMVFDIRQSYLIF